MNIILIMADQLSAKWIGCYGNEGAATPHLDAIAARGARFDNCIVNHPLCMPSRVSTMTGRSPQHHGVLFNGYELDPAIPTYPGVLRKAGVETLGVGKFHLECELKASHHDVSRYGFERALVTEDTRSGDWLDWIERYHPSQFELALSTVWPGPFLEHYGAERRDLREALRLAQRKYPTRNVAWNSYPTPLSEEICQTQWITDRGIEFLEQRDPSRPFFLALSYVDPHDPYDPPARWLERIDPTRVPPPIPGNPSLDAVLRWFGENVYYFKPVLDLGLHPSDWMVIRRHYLASLAFVDAQVGRLMSYLDDAGLCGQTTVIFTSDHGDMLGDHGLPFKGPSHFDASIRVPLIAAGPNVLPGVRSQVVSNLDLFPTITDLSGVVHCVPLEGSSLRPLFESIEGLNRPGGVLVESFGPWDDRYPSFRVRTVRTADAALTLYDRGPATLFDLDTDPCEECNLWGRPEAAALEARLKDLMLDLQVRQYDPLPRARRNPTYFV